MDRLTGLTSRHNTRRTFKAINVPDNAHALTNCLIANPRDFKDGQYVICNNNFVLSVRTYDAFPPGSVGLNGNQRLWARLSLDEEVTVQPFDLTHTTGSQSYLGTMNIEIRFRNRAKATSVPFDQDELSETFIKRFLSQIFQPTQNLVFEFKGYYFDMIVRSVQIVDLAHTSMAESSESTVIRSKGFLTEKTMLNFFSGDQLVQLKSSTSRRMRTDPIIRPDFKFADMGIGGLDAEFTLIFRRAFASRILPPDLVDNLGINHVKGMLLYGPPGTGKTLIARQIGKMLNAREPKVVNGPEILSKYVGSSEENIRKLFADAELEYKKKGDQSGLHIIIFDELDSVFKQRGSRGDGTGVADNVVNQLLAKMDGVDQLNNILVIGMTNRRDLIDEALLRPGRFEVQVEIHLPDEYGRKQILEIKTKKMRDSNMLGNDVNLNELAALTKNFSGAEIEGLVKSASSFAINRHIKVGNAAAMDEGINNMKVTRNDFLQSLDDVKPAFGVNEEDLRTVTQGGIIKFSPRIDEILNHGKRYLNQVKESEKTSFISLLMHGPPGSGKTALAASIALASEFPFIKMISPESMVGKSEAAKILQIDNTFRDSYKSPLNVLLIDNIEGLIDWVPIGPRFSNPILQALKVYWKNSPPEGHRLLIISTTSSHAVLEQLDVLSCFHNEIAVPNVTSVNEFHKIMQDSDFLDENSRNYVSNGIAKLEENHGARLNVGIKKLLTNIDTAKFDTDEANELIELMAQNMAQR